jgi:predicted amino acid racemase
MIFGARVIVELCKAHGIEVTGVTKGTCGNPGGARAMLRGGVTSIGESRMLNIAGLKPLDPHVLILGASSDYVIVDVTHATPAIAIGDHLAFGLGYGALPAAMTSPYVEKRAANNLAAGGSASRARV